MTKMIKHINRIECFRIGLFEAEDIFQVSSWKMIKEISGLNRGVFEEPTTIIADPFLFVKNDRLYLFYENKKMYKNGVISMTYTENLKDWSNPITVLNERCHLSYPWVFEDEGNVYMIPETSGINSINIYIADDNLTSFKFLKTILKDEKQCINGFSFSDSSIFFKDGEYYLMTTINDGEKNILKLYTSDLLFGEYKEHLSSPIYIGNKYGRNAGNIFKYKDKLYRVSQDCVERYGDNVHLLEIIRMNSNEYLEKTTYDYLFSNTIDFYKDGGHQLNYVRFNGKNIIATDAKQYKYMLKSRILHKLGCY